MRLWETERVNAAEQLERFQSYQDERQARSARSSATAEKKRQALLRQIEDLPIDAPRHSEAEILDASLAAWHNHKDARDDYGANGHDASLEVRFRWAVNFIRHELTRYDAILYNDLAGQIGRAEAGRLLRRRILERIAEVYPEFANEAHRQAGNR